MDEETLSMQHTRSQLVDDARYHHTNLCATGVPFTAMVRWLVLAECDLPREARAVFQATECVAGETMSKPRLLDLFCCAGGAAVGYARAGFDVVGVDIRPQPHYPFSFVQDDALTISLDGFDAYHASPPCQLYSITNRIWKKAHPDLVDAIRRRLVATGKPYVLENVPGAPLPASLVLCGTMFGLGVLRHRLFESNVLLFVPGSCRHQGSVKTGEYISVFGKGGNGYTKARGSLAMGIEWMTVRELSQAIPPAYTEWLGRQLKEVIA